ncbi:MAG: OmpH family outer membrane protein [Candidatus Gastranaerophilales bacterium]|nr:OmpH family outer membrane protein [Candidatus Gastranaerophilales bacterium]
MKKQIKVATLAVCTFALGLCINNAAFSDIASFKIATVDVQQVVSSSSQVKALKAEQQAKIKDLQSFVATAKKAVSDEKDANKKKALEDKYNKELKAKTGTIEKEYAKKLQDIDSTISTSISNEAKAKNYNLVLAKGVVLYGGDDITTSVIKAVK